MKLPTQTPSTLAGFSLGLKSAFLVSLFTLTAPQQSQAQVFDANQAPLSAPREIRLGLMLPLSGPMAEVGTDILKAAQLAIFDQPYTNLRLYPIDTPNTPAGAQTAFATLQDLNVDLILGPLLANSVTSLRDNIRVSGVPVISFSSDRSVAGNGVYLLSFSPAEQARAMARFAKEEGKLKIAALVPETPFGQEMLSAFRDEATAQGLTLLKEVFYDPNARDLSKPIREIGKLRGPQRPIDRERNALEAEARKLGNITALTPEKRARLRELRKIPADKTVTFDALFMPSSAPSLPLLTSQLVFNDIDTNNLYLLGGSAWDDPKTLISRGEYMKNAFFPAPNRQVIEHFRTRYAEQYGASPHPLAVLGYDGVAAVSQMLGAGYTYRLGSALSPEYSYRGASGQFRFIPEGLAERQYDILQITPEGFTTYKAGPTAFAPVTFQPRAADPIEPAAPAPHLGTDPAPELHWFEHIFR